MQYCKIPWKISAQLQRAISVFLEGISSDGTCVLSRSLLFIESRNSGTYHSKVIFFHASRASKSKAGLRSRTPFHFSLQAP